MKMGKNILRMLSVLLSVMMMVLTLAACGGNKDIVKDEVSEKAESTAKVEEKKEPVKLNLYINQADDKMTKVIEFMKTQFPTKLPNIQVEMNAFPGDAQTFETKIRTMISAGADGLDVWWERGGSFAVPILAAKSALPLDKYLDEERFWDNVIPSAKVPNGDGNIYAVPFEDIFYEIMFCNPTIFKDNNLQAPKTVAELKNIVGVLKTKGITPIAVSGKDGWPAAMMIEGFAYAKDQEATKKVVEGKAKFSETAYAASANAVKELMDLGGFSKNVAMDDYGTAEGLFVTGKAAMMCNGSWALGDYDTKMKGNVDYFFYPAMDDADVAKVGKSLAGGVKKDAGMMVYSMTKNPKEAVQLAIVAAQLYNQYLYEELGNTFIAYIPEKLGWKIKSDFSPIIKKFAGDISNFSFTYGFVQDVMPSAPGSKGVMEAASKFMTNSAKYTVDDYLADMDKAAAEK